MVMVEWMISKTFNHKEGKRMSEMSKMPATALDSEIHWLEPS
jgi:hypothetical protein